MAALLDELKIEKVLVYGISGGGPTCLNFALKHPNRCFGIMTEVAIYGNFKHPKFDQL
jgi:pimeloyl-ACP methyl ester carboxylesterase